MTGAEEPSRSTNWNLDGSSNVNAGSGQQINHNYFAEARKRRRDPHLVAQEHVVWLARRFEPPARYPADALRDPGTVVLCGPPGSGSHAAALMLLTQTGTVGVSGLRRLADRSEEQDEPPLDTDGLRENERLLLDLTETDDERMSELQVKLEAYRAAVELKRARLVVVVRPKQVRLLADSLKPWVKPLERPDGVRVLAAHLRADGISPLTSNFPGTAIDQFAAIAPMRDIANLAGWTRDARETKPRATPEDWLAAAWTAQAEGESEAARLFEKHHDSAARALIVVSAFVQGASLAALVEAETEFHRVVKLPKDDTHVLEGQYLALRMQDIRLRTGGQPEVRFERLALDEAVRTHFWTYFPLLREKMFGWVSATAALPSMADASAELVGRFTEQVLTTGPIDRLTRLTRQWCDGNKPRPELAQQVLATGLRHDRWDRKFRRLVYDWSGEPNLPPLFAQVLITACVDEIAPVWLTQALVRLRRFTRHQDGEVSAVAHQSLLDLVHARDFQRWLLYQLVNSPLRSADREILFGLRVPHDMADEHHTRRNLVECWSRVLADRPNEIPVSALHRWLDQDPAVLVEACAGHVHLLNDLYLIARAWVRTAPDDTVRQTRLTRARQLQRQIDSVLGFTGLEDH